MNVSVVVSVSPKSKFKEFVTVHNEPEQDRAKVIKAYVDWILSQISKKK